MFSTFSCNHTEECPKGKAGSAGEAACSLPAQHPGSDLLRRLPGSEVCSTSQSRESLPPCPTEAMYIIVLPQRTISMYRVFNTISAVQFSAFMCTRARKHAYT